MSSKPSEIFCEKCGVSYHLRHYLKHIKAHEEGATTAFSSESTKEKRKMSLECEICGKTGISSESTCNSFPIILS